MASLSRSNAIIDCGGKITNSTIDMNGDVITNHGTPTNGTDVVNKDYVDSSTGGVPSISVTLTGTNFTTILSAQSGVFQIYIKNVVTDGPSGAFSLCKSEATRETSFFRFASSPGATTEERLDIRWSPNSGIELRKTGVNYDGDYNIKYIETL